MSNNKKQRVSEPEIENKAEPESVAETEPEEEEVDLELKGIEESRLLHSYTLEAKKRVVECQEVKKEARTTRTIEMLRKTFAENAKKAADTCNEHVYEVKFFAAGVVVYENFKEDGEEWSRALTWESTGIESVEGDEPLVEECDGEFFFIASHRVESEDAESYGIRFFAWEEEPRAVIEEL